MKKLLEAFWEKESVSDYGSNIRDAINSRASVALDSFPIYKGISKKVPDMFISNPPKERKSLTLKGWPHIIIDHLHPSWSHFPKRSESIICTMNKSIARGYGPLYRVFPFADPDTGVTISDFFLSTVHKNITRIDSALQFLNIKRRVPNLQDPSTSIQLIEDIEDMIHRLIDTYLNDDNTFNRQEARDELEIINRYLFGNIELSKLIAEFEHTSFKDHLFKLLEPNDDTKVMKLSEIDLRYGEIWFSQKAIFVRDELFRDLM